MQLSVNKDAPFSDQKALKSSRRGSQGHVSHICCFPSTRVLKTSHWHISICRMLTDHKLWEGSSCSVHCYFPVEGTVPHMERESISTYWRTVFPGSGCILSILNMALQHISQKNEVAGRLSSFEQLPNSLSWLKPGIHLRVWPWLGDLKNSRFEWWADLSSNSC